MTLAPATVAAQGVVLSDRGDADAAGIRLGNLELHPGIAAEAGYQNNVFFDEDEPEGSVILRVTPSLHIATLGKERTGEDARAAQPVVRFHAGVAGGVYAYMSAVSRDPQFSADADVDLLVLPERPFSFGVGLLVSRAIRPVVRAENPGAAGRTGQADYGRNQFLPSARLMLQTRGGILKTELAGSTRLEFYDEGVFDASQTMQLSGKWLTTWEFLPKTAIFEETAVVSQTFNGDGSPSSNVMRNDGLLLTSRLGVNGAITPELGTTLAVGYAAAYFNDYDATGGIASGETIRGNDQDGLVAQALLRWSPAKHLRTRIGYTRRYTLAYQGNQLRSDGIDAGVDAVFAGTFLAGINGGFALSSFGVDEVAATAISRSEAQRNDTRFDIGVKTEYRFLSWLSASLSASYQQLSTEFEMPVDTMNTEPVEWSNYELWAGLRAEL